MLLRAPDVLRIGPPTRDLVTAGVLGFLAVVLFVHTIRRMSTQDPPPPGETRLLAWVSIVLHGASIILAVTGTLDGPRGTEPVPVPLHAVALLLAGAMLSSIHLVIRRRSATPSF